MFEELSQRFEDAVKGLRGQATISETNVDEAFQRILTEIYHIVSKRALAAAEGEGGGGGGAGGNAPGEGTKIVVTDAAAGGAAKRSSCCGS